MIKTNANREKIFFQSFRRKHLVDVSFTSNLRNYSRRYEYQKSINIKTRKVKAQYITTSLKTPYVISVREKQRCEVMTKGVVSKETVVAVSVGK